MGLGSVYALAAFLYYHSVVFLHHLRVASHTRMVLIWSWKKGKNWSWIFMEFGSQISVGTLHIFLHLWPPEAFFLGLQIRTFRDRTRGELYIDGELVASGDSGPGARLLQTTSPFYWGGVPVSLTVNNNDVNVSSWLANFEESFFMKTDLSLFCLQVFSLKFVKKLYSCVLFPSARLESVNEILMFLYSPMNGRYLRLACRNWGRYSI